MKLKNVLSKLKVYYNKQIIINENPNLLNILVIDCGIKNSQIRALLKHNVQLTIVDTNYNFINKVFNNKYDGIFISNGPGNPKSSVNVVSQLKQIFGLSRVACK